MNLFITGGTGYLGSAVTAALLADGHKVRAHVRSVASADRLPGGAEPVAGDLGDAAWLRARIDESDGVVHAASPNDATSGSFDAAFLDVALAALAGSDRPLVYTGGTWVHGSGDPITEQSPVNPPPMVAWRPAILQRLQTAAADGIRTVVIAPANVYGAGAGIPAMLRGAPTTAGTEPALLYVGNGKQRFTNVHHDDIATLYALGVRTAPAGSYYLGANAHSPTMTELATAASRSRGLNGRIAAEPEADSRARLGLFLDSLLLDVTVDTAHARTLGWTPTGPSLIDELTDGSYVS
jgi:nucleoside-diphosphate-sugar epimerase